MIDRLLFLGAGLCLGLMVGVAMNYNGAAAWTVTPDSGLTSTSGPKESEAGSTPACAFSASSPRENGVHGPASKAGPAGGTSPSVKKPDVAAGETALLSAIAEVESGTNDAAWNRAEDARGRWQIRPAYWADAMEYGGASWPHTDAHDPVKTRQVILWYWARYGADTDEKRARMHNGGDPHGMECADTIVYWAKVQAELDVEVLP